MGADVQEEDIKMQGQKFTYKKVSYEVVNVKMASDNFRTQLGWTHHAEVKRSNGSLRFANLLVVNGIITQVLVVV